MRFLKSLPEDPQLWDALKRFPKGTKYLFQHIDIVLRGPSPLTIGQRELIGVFVSKLNSTEFCVNAHGVFARAFGIQDDVLTALTDDIDHAPVEGAFKPILRYARKLTLTPLSMEEKDVKAILGAGWPEEAVFDTASVVGLFSLLNRLVKGLGITGHEQEFAQVQRELSAASLAERLAANQSKVGDDFYSGMCREFGIIGDD